MVGNIQERKAIEINREETARSTSVLFRNANNLASYCRRNLNISLPEFISQNSTLGLDQATRVWQHIQNQALPQPLFDVQVNQEEISGFMDVVGSIEL